MTNRQAFWDASAVIPLCVPQTPTSLVRPLTSQYAIVWWWGTTVEIAAGLARLLRMHQISASVWKRAQHDAERLAASAMCVPPSDDVRDGAVNLVTQYDLRAGDALQLAAALQWCENKPRGQVFLTLDKRLREAALLCGFDAKTL